MADRPSASLDSRARVVLPLLIAALAALTAYRLYFAPHPGPFVEFTGSTMGTTYMVKVASPDLDSAAQRDIATAIRRELDRVTALMSTYVADSEVSRFNGHHSLTPFAVSPETAYVFEIAREVSDWSSGAFDVTVAPLVRAWGFGANVSGEVPPSPRELAALRESVGYHNLAIDREGGTLQKRLPGLECDLSAVAKGYAVDRVSLALVELGFANALVEIGGELRATGTRADGQAWHVAIERPDPTQRSVYQIIELTDRALATSGDYRNYYEIEGRRVSHTIDPRTGQSISHDLASVSVLHTSAAYADALATALNVLGPIEGYELAVELELAALFIVRGANELGTGLPAFETRTTPTFERALASTSSAKSPP